MRVCLFFVVALIACGGDEPESTAPSETARETPSTGSPSTGSPSTGSTASSPGSPSAGPQGTRSSATPGFALVPRQPARGGEVFVVPGKPQGLVAQDALTLFDIPSGAVRAQWAFRQANQIQFDDAATKILLRADMNEVSDWGEEDFSSPSRVHLIDLSTGTTTTVWDDGDEIEERTVTDARLHPSGDHVALLRVLSGSRSRIRGSMAVVRPGQRPRWTRSEALSLLYSRQGSVMVSTEESALVLHDPRTGAVRQRVEIAGVTGLSMHPSDEVVAVETDSELVLVNLTDGRVAARTEFDGIGDALAWSPDGLRVGACGEDHFVHVFAAANLTPEPAGAPVPCRAAPDLRGRTAAYDGQVWRTGDATVPVGGSGHYAAHPPDRPTWSLVSTYEAVSILNHEAGRMRPLLRSDRDAERLATGARLHPRGLEIFAGGTFQLGTLPASAEFPTPPFTPRPELTQVSPDGQRRVVMASDGESVQAVLQIAGTADPIALDVSELELECVYGPDQTDCSVPVVFHRGGLLLTNNVHYMHFDNAGHRLGHRSEVYDTRFVADETGTRFATLHDDGSVRMAGPDLNPAKRLLAPREGQALKEVRFAPGRSTIAITRGASLVIADADGEVQHRVALPHPAVLLELEGDQVRVGTAEALLWVSIASGEITRTVELGLVGVSPAGSTRVLHCQRRELLLRTLATGEDIAIGACPYPGWPAGVNETHAWWGREGRVDFYRVADGARLTVRVFGTQRAFALAYTPEGQVELSDPSAVSRVRMRAAGPVLDAALSDLEPSTLVHGLVERYMAGEVL